MPTSDGSGSHLFPSNPVHHHHRHPTKRTVKCKCFRMCIFCFHSTANTVAKFQNIAVSSTSAQVCRAKNAMQTKMIIIIVICFSFAHQDYVREQVNVRCRRASFHIAFAAVGMGEFCVLAFANDESVKVWSRSRCVKLDCVEVTAGINL